MILTHGIMTQVSRIMLHGKLLRKIWEFEENSRNSFVLDDLTLSLAQACLATVSPNIFWSISDQYPDLACFLHVQIKVRFKNLSTKF